MKAGWEVKRLGELCSVITKGTTPTSMKFSFIDQGINFVKVESIDQSGDFLPRKFAYISEECHNSFKRSRLYENDILYSIAGALGRVAIVNKDILPANTNQALAIIRLADINYSQPSFVEYCLKSQQVFLQIEKFKAGVAQLNLSLEQVKEIQILLPPVSEQQRIVSILDEAFDAIAKAKENAQKNLESAKEVFESYLQCVFANPGDGWEEKTLSQVSNHFGRGKSRHRPRNDKTLYNGKYPFIQTGDIRNCEHFILEYSQTYNEIGLSQSKLWPIGTICITIAANIAETGILTFESCFPDSVIGIVLNPEIADTDFVEYLLQSLKARLQAKGKGSAQDNINMGTFENELFSFPPLTVQHSIVAKLDALSLETKKLEAIYAKKLSDLEELKKSILQKAFNGEL